MNDTVQSKERAVLIISAGGCLAIGSAAIVFWWISDSQAILLDGLFNLTYFLTGTFTLKVAELVRRSDDERFPYGYGFFEPLINGIKGVLVLGISLMALFGAVDALLSGGRQIGAGAAIGYGVFATIACVSMAIVTHRGAGRSGSPLVKADADNWYVNGAISSAVLIAFLGILLIQGTDLEFITPYVDPSVVLLVVLISISVPIRMAWQAIMELLNRAPPPDIVTQVRNVVANHTADLPVQELFVRVVQPGRTRMVLAHVVLPADFEVEILPKLDAIRLRTLQALRAEYPAVFLDMLFTADRQWGAPAIAGK